MKIKLPNIKKYSLLIISLSMLSFPAFSRDTTISYTLKKYSAPDNKQQSCHFNNYDLSDKIIVYAGSGVNRKRTQRYIDGSGQMAKTFEVIVNSPDKAVAIILTEYDPAIWHFAWTKGTKIEAVLIVGHHRQMVSGLSGQTPIIVNSEDRRNVKVCGVLLKRVPAKRAASVLSQRAFGKAVSVIKKSKDGTLVFGEKVTKKTRLLTTTDYVMD